MAWSLHTHSSCALFHPHLIKTKMGEGDLEGGGRCRGIDKGEGGRRERGKRKIGEEINKRPRKKGWKYKCMHVLYEREESGKEDKMIIRKWRGE
jgi:hypothetical protein